MHRGQDTNQEALVDCSKGVHRQNIETMNTRALLGYRLYAITEFCRGSDITG